MISTVPAVLDALVASWSAALPDAQVVDGQPLRVDRDIVCVGFTGDPGDVAVESTRTREQVAVDPDHEAYAITCVASSLRGETETKLVRDRVYAMVDTLATMLVADQSLGGVAAQTRLTTERFVQEQSTEGAVATVQFVVFVDAWTD
ncbi:hypothetical protein [Nonomuraea dietziae]|uniref:hypothetical protein n=1 Tax=Nonomuraea dietziae TaxID=65515 RepID=UPI00341ED54E